MRLQASIDVTVPGEGVIREPSFWERAKRAFGWKLDLTTDKVRVAIEAASVVDRVRTALGAMGVGNAVSLVIDDQVIFSDTKGTPDDMGDLLIAMSEHAPVFGGGFRSLRLAVEHEEAGLHMVIESVASTVHTRGEPTVAVRLGGRVRELEASPGESAEQYRRRVEPIVKEPALLDGHRRQFEAFTARLADTLRSAFPEARVEERKPDAIVVRPSQDMQPEATLRRPPTHPAYDPYPRYYSSPMEGMLSGMLIGSFMMSAFRPHDIMVVHPSGAPIGSADEIGDHAADVSPDAPDPGLSPSESDLADGAGGDFESGDGGDGGDGDWGGGDGDFGGGGDWGGGFDDF